MFLTSVPRNTYIMREQGQEGNKQIKNKVITNFYHLLLEFMIEVYFQQSIVAVQFHRENSMVTGTQMHW